MITEDKYIILDKPIREKILKTTLCILNYNLISELEVTKKIILENPLTTFWAVTKDFSKDYVKTASKLGIQNLLQYPIKTDVIKDFFEKKSGVFCTSFDKQLDNSSVLVVDDNELNIELLTEILSDIGVKVTTCTNPLNAIDLVNKRKFDLVLLDILMPEASGFEIAEIIHKSELNFSTQIIFISAISGEENIMNGYSLGACSYIEKPFSPSIVKAQIYNILKSVEDKNKIEKEKDNFVATLTHDLKGPISAEICALNQMIKNNCNSANVEMLDDLLSTAKYMKQMTDQILCHYRQEKTDINLKKETIKFNELVLSCIEEMKYLTTDKNIRIRYYNNINDAAVLIDMLEIKRVINNLISNAIEYSYPNSFIDIVLEKETTNIIFKIQDYGIGIDLDKYSNVFDEYMTLSKEHKKIGFGLGLKICKSIIKAHNGDIKIKSALNKGTQISFSIPE